MTILIAINEQILQFIVLMSFCFGFAGNIDCTVLKKTFGPKYKTFEIRSFHLKTYLHEDELF